MAAWLNLSLLWDTISKVHRYLLRFVGRSRSADRPSSAPPPQEIRWRASVDQVITELEHMNQTTEQDFLSVGGKLMEFRSAARQISAEMAALTDLISGEQGNKTSGALGRILEHSKAMDEQAEVGGRALGNIRDLACRIPVAFAGLAGRVMLFRTLCTLTRIETSRLGSAGSGFEGLAEAVKPLSESIHASGERVLAASSQLQQRIQSALQSGCDLQSRQLAELRALIDSEMASLRSFEQRRQQAHEASLQQGRHYEGVCRAIDELVQSLQFHDITRQQIEHVTQSLRQIRQESLDHQDQAVPPQEVRAVVHLQAMQLSSAERAFASSVARTRGGLEDIASRVLEMSETSRSLMGLDSQAHDSFFLQMERCCSAILEAIGTCRTESGQIQSMAAQLEETIASMQKSVAEIRDIEIQMQRIAINAAIRAAHIHDEGTALDTIARIMQGLVLESSKNTEDAADALDAMTCSIHGLSWNPETMSADRGKARNILDEMRGAVRELHASSESSYERVNQIAGLGATLGDGIRTVLSGFTAGELFAEVVTRSRTELQQLLLGSADSAIEDSDLGIDTSSEAFSASLERFASNYTMQAERDVHRSAAVGDDLGEAVSVGEAAVAVEEGDLGDNVELF
jgi:hypothetical protein